MRKYLGGAAALFCAGLWLSAHAHVWQQMTWKPAPGSSSSQVWSLVNSNIELTDGAHTATQATGDFTVTPGYTVVGVTAGKYFWMLAANFSDNNPSYGIGNTISSTTDGQYLGFSNDTTMGVEGNNRFYYSTGSNALLANIGVVAGAPSSLGIALDMDNKKIWVQNYTSASGWNGDILANQDPATNTGGLAIPSTVYTSPVVPAFNLYRVGDSIVGVFSQSLWTQSAPTGFLQLP